MLLLHAKSPQAAQPPNSNIRLKPHQLAMLKKCNEIESLNYKYGILADKPGAGKTYVLLSMILCDEVKGLNIIVVPQNIYTQWIQAIQAFSDVLTFTTYVNYEDISSLYYVPELPKCDIIITTALYYNIVADSLSSSTSSKLMVKRVILDEIDSIDQCVQKKIDCEMMWLVSASYAKERIENTLASSQNGIDLAMEQDVMCKCEEAFVSASFALESPKQIDYICKSSYLDLMLKDLLDDKELQAAYASDFSLIARRTYKNVAQNDKQAIDFLIKDLRMTIDGERVKLDSYLKKGTDLNDIEVANKDECTQIITECIDKLANIHKKIEKYDLCVGCLDKFEDTKRTRTFCCQNDMCSKCIDNWYNKTLYCPYCRSKVEQTRHTIVAMGCGGVGCGAVGCGSQPAPEISATSRDKINMLLHLLRNQTGRKVIIFSDYSKIFNTITTLLNENGMRYVELDGGNVKALDKILHEYKAGGGARVLMLNSAFYGCGMNLENTTDIIFFHKTDRIMYEQVIGRAQRPGRNSRLVVHNLLYLNE
jgi:SNF2 family DNA or RNA helicase